MDQREQEQEGERKQERWHAVGDAALRFVEELDRATGSSGYWQVESIGEESELPQFMPYFPTRCERSRKITINLTEA